VTARPVRRHAAFEADFLAQLDWLVARDNAEWIRRLRTELHQVVRMLSAFPGAGSRLDAEGPLHLRKIIFPTVPYVAWYVYDATDESGDLWLVRLFHVRQTRPEPEAARYVAAIGGKPRAHRRKGGG
jgi:plasmid stabilization system protein ParE